MTTISPALGAAIAVAIRSPHLLAGIAERLLGELGRPHLTTWAAAGIISHGASQTELARTVAGILARLHRAGHLGIGRNEQAYLANPVRVLGLVVARKPHHHGDRDLATLQRLILEWSTP